MHDLENAASPKKTAANNWRIVLCVILSALSILWLGYRIISFIRSENERREQIATASENAVRYIRNKYGFEAEILDDPGDDKFLLAVRHSELYMPFKMKSGDKEFYVAADRLKESDDCVDSYQSEEIAAAITDKISEIQGGGRVIWMWVGIRRDYLGYKSMFRKYFNGNNIDEVLEDCKGGIEMVFADADFSENKLPEKLEQWNMQFKLVSFDTPERVEEFAKIDYIDEHTYEIYAPYITDYTEQPQDGVESGISYSLKSYDDFQYCYFPTDVNKYKDSSDNVEISEMRQSDFSYHFEYHNEEYWISKPLSKAYQFKVLYGDVCVYYPLEKFKDKDIEQIGAAWYSVSGFSDNYDIVRADICGEYAVFTMPTYGQEFMLVDNFGQEEFIPAWKKGR